MEERTERRGRRESEEGRDERYLKHAPPDGSDSERCRHSPRFFSLLFRRQQSRFGRFRTQRFSFVTFERCLVTLVRREYVLCYGVLHDARVLYETTQQATQKSHACLKVRDEIYFRRTPFPRGKRERTTQTDGFPLSQRCLRAGEAVTRNPVVLLPRLTCWCQR